ncbi:hypothetical protein BKA82DRAFT_14218 [Pisolithus tinctorius]|uniref:Uncharacterized protein n=1 Tax=Pisolithus tinctorius Marx 270 TaxID=870435 RepID=A0A0C3PKD8_PISTI|nr:hypothetical protein BKA82DRAFT_14218 [Pisolithus tinctorius]KIO09111.1 hypothetical protein M404DRAFT_14218 [Pisolithus tinctorius Marx 270]
MAKLDPADEQLLKSALGHPFEPADVPIQPAVPPPVGSNEIPAPTANALTEPVTSAEPAEEDPWKAEFEAQVEEWRAKSAEDREKAEHERAKWEAIRKQEEEERLALGQEPETWESLGSHITTSIAAASEVLAGSTPSLVSIPSRTEGAEKVVSEKPESTPNLTPPSTGPPSYQQSYPSLSLSGPSGSQSSSHRRDSFPVEYPPSPPRRTTEAKATNPPPSTLPSILDGTIKRRTRLSLILSSLAINLLLPFINGVMLGFGEIFAKNVLVGWFGWKLRSGRTAASVGLRP